MKSYTHIFLSSIFLLFAINTKAQNGIEWNACFESTLANNRPNSACKTPDGGYIIAGSTARDTIMWPNQMGLSDFAVIRVDSVGNMIWKKTYGGNGGDGANCIIKGIRDNRYYIAGSTNSESSTNLHMPSYDAWLIAIDDAGNMLWDRCYGGNMGEDFYSLVQLGDSNQIYGIGITGSINNGDVIGGYNGTETGWLCKINANNGMLLNAKVYGGTGGELLLHSEKLNNSNFLVQGWSYSRDHDVWVHYGNGFMSNTSGWLLNIDTALNIVWQKTIGSSGGGWVNDLEKTQDGGFAVFGSTINVQGDTSSFNFYVDTTVFGYGKREAFIIKYDSLGNELWQQHYSTPLDPINPDGPFVQMKDKGFVFSAEVNKWNGYALWPYNHGTVLFRTDSTGNLISASRYGDNYLGSLMTTKFFTTWNNKLVVVSSNSPACSSGYLGKWSIFQIGHQLSIRDKENLNNSIKIFPNPSTGVFNVEFKNTVKAKQIVIYNALGQIVKSIALNKTISNYKIDLAGNSKGIYFIGIETDSDIIFKKVILN